MSPLCIVGRGRVGAAISAMNSQFTILSSRSPDFLAKLENSVGTDTLVLVTARDTIASSQFNLELAARIADAAVAVDVKPDRILHFSSYSADRTGKFTVGQRVEKADRRRGWAFLEHLRDLVSSSTHTVL